MKVRLIRNIATTLLGVGVLVYTMVMMYNGTPWTDLIGYFGLSGLLLRSKDSLIGLKPKDK